jgi:hypothetical protein
MKLKTIGLSLLASTALVSGITSANAGLKPGLYEIDGIQEICLLNGGTWFSPTFSGWGGTWLNNTTTGALAKSLIRGNYASGAGNDSIIVKRGHAGWNEWRDTESYTADLDPVTWSKIGTCSAATRHHPHSNKANPAQ